MRHSVEDEIAEIEKDMSALRLELAQLKVRRARLLQPLLVRPIRTMPASRRQATSRRMAALWSARKDGAP